MKIKFGTDGFRGVIGKDFTFKTALHAGSLAMRYFKSANTDGMAVGYDTRFLSAEVASEMAEMASATGYRSYLSEGFCPSPVLSFFVHRKRLNFGIMITASHNPANFNGVKIKESFGGSALAETIKKISQMPTETNIEPAGTGGVRRIDMKSLYFSALRKRFNALERGSKIRKILVNPMFGAAMGYLSGFLSGNNFTVKEINNTFNPSFGGVTPEPVEENMAETKSLILKERFDVAFAFDGDGDRIACLDDNGDFYSSQRLLPLILHYMINAAGKKGLVVKTVSTTSMLSRVAIKNGLKIKEVPIGFKNIVPYFLNNKAVIGGEESGGIAVSGYIPERDGIYCALLVLEILAYYGKGLAELWADMEREYGRFYFKREDYVFEDEQRTRSLLNALDIGNIGRFKVVEKNFMDGRKFILAGGSFLLLRVSGTEPVVRVYAEADRNEKLGEIFSWTRKLLRESGVVVNKHG